MRPPLWHILAAVGLGVWTIAVTVLAQLALYALDAISAVTWGTPGSDATQVGIGVIAAALVCAPAAVAAALPFAGEVRVVLRAWAWAGGASAVLAAARLAPATSHELYLLGLASAAVLAALTQRRLSRSWTSTTAGAVVDVQDRGRGLSAASTGGLLMLVPWAWMGALGGALETLLAVAAASAVGWLAATTTAPLRGADFQPVPLDRGLRSAAPAGGPGGGRSAVRRLVVGAAAGVALVPIAGGTGETGVALAQLVVLPPLGFAVVQLARGAGVLVALAAAGPLALVDPEETTLLLGTRDVGFWTLVAGAGAFLIAVLFAIGLALTGRLRLSAIRGPVAAGLVAVLGLGVVAVHVGLGQPGLHGDRLFVVLRQQADLTGLDTIADRDERLRQTYRRLVEHAERTQAGLRSELHRYRVGFRPYYLVNGLEVDGGPAVRTWLAGRAEVDRVLTDPELRPLPAEQTPLGGGPDRPDGPLWNIQMIRADRVWEAANARGGGIVIGASDSGVDGAHPVLAGGFRGGDDSWYDPWNGTAVPTDHNGHGTHTLGSALGRDGIGVAPEASWIGCVNLDRNIGSPAHYLDCLQFMLAPFPRTGDPMRDGRPERAAHVLTNSWGCPELEGCDGTVLRPALTALTAAGIFVVAAAGNTGDAGCGSITDEPAIDPEAITVGAVTRTGAVPSFSSRGPVAGAAKPDVMAPGTQIVSAVPGGGYRAEQGTSMATPHVAGVVALMWSANPGLIGNVARTAAILRSTARLEPLVPPRNDCGDPRNVRGAGLVDALAAVTAATAIGP